MLLSLDAITVYANARMGQLIGYSPEEILGHPLSDFLFEEDLEDHERRMERRRQGISESYDRRWRHKDGHVVWTHISATPLRDDDDRVVGFLGMMTDITTRKAVEDDLKRRNEELERFERAVVGRELRMKELKAQITELEQELAECRELARGF